MQFKIVGKVQIASKVGSVSSHSCSVKVVTRVEATARRRRRHRRRRRRAPTGQWRAPAPAAPGRSASTPGKPVGLCPFG